MSALFERADGFVWRTVQVVPFVWIGGNIGRVGTGPEARPTLSYAIARGRDGAGRRGHQVVGGEGFIC